MKKRGFTLIELLAVIIVLAIIMVLTIPNVLSSMNKAKNEAMVTFAKKVRRTAQEYAFVHQDEFTSDEPMTKTISDIMGDSGNYEGTIVISKDGNTYIRSLKYKSENKILCNIAQSDTLDTSNIQNASTCSSGGGSNIIT